MLVEYDLSFRPLRKYTGLQAPSDVTPLADGTILLVDEGSQTVMLFDHEGRIHWSEQIGKSPTRARPRPEGGLLVTSGDEVIALRPDRTVEWRRAVGGIRSAAPLHNGNVLVAHNERNGWLSEMTPAGEIVWRTQARDPTSGHISDVGQWVDATPDLFFHSVWSLDVNADGVIFATDFDRPQLRIVAADRQHVQVFPGLPHVTDTRIGPGGYFVAVSPEAFKVWLLLPDGTINAFQPDMRPRCANFTAQGTLLVGLVWQPENALLNATKARAQPPLKVPWRQQGLPVSVLSALAALGVVYALRRHEPQAAESAPEPTNAREAAAAATASADRRIGTAIWVGVLSVSAYLAWQGIAAIQKDGFSLDTWRFAVGCLAGGVALWALNAGGGCLPTLSSFVPARLRPAQPRPDREAETALVSLAFAAVVACMVVQRYVVSEQAIAVGLWLAAQIWIVAAAFPATDPGPSRRAPWQIIVLLGLVLLGTIATRFWKIGYYPDLIHHDHSIYGTSALRMLEGDWKPFFIRKDSVGRPWMALCAAGLLLFGPHFWVVRLLTAVSGVVVVFGTYLLGSALFNRRVGLIACFLASVNHVLLLYSRQPYVLDPVAPFVLSIYCALVGWRRGCRLHWCVAGVLTGWALLGYWSSITFVPVGIALLLYCAAVYPRETWRNRAGVLWLLGGAAVVYLPTQWQSIIDSTISHRIASTVILLNPDGTLRWDTALWGHQLARSFGAIFRYADSAPWGVSTGKPICLLFESCLFGIGLVYLLRSWRIPATFLIIAWIGICLFLGAATLPDAPTYYHLLAAVVPIVLTCAVALDRGLALTDRWQPRVWRVTGALAAIVLLGAAGFDDLREVWLSVRRPQSTAGVRVLRTDLKPAAARVVGEHRRYRTYLVRTHNDVSCADPMFLFFTAGADVSDLTTKLEDALPVAPVEPAAGASFVVLPSRSDERQLIADMYPTAHADQIRFLGHDATIWVYLVDAAAVRQVYEARGPTTHEEEQAASEGARS